MVRVKSSRARAALFCVSAVALLCSMSSVAAAWNVDYPSGTCFSTANGVNQCQMGYTHALTYNSGSAPGLQNGVCVYAITAAGNIRGGGAVPCTSSSSFINECFSSGATPDSNAHTYAYVSDKVLTGHADDSSGHTGCI